jgi:hypothetical protein
MPSRPLLVDPILPRAGLAGLVGARGLGKSLLALSLAASVALTEAHDFLGLPVRQHTPVLYLALEGFAGLSERIRAWEANSGFAMGDASFVAEPVDLKDNSWADAVADVAVGIGAGLVIVDSARAAGAGAEDTADMGAFVRGLEHITSRTGGLTLCLHNTGWEGKRERGSTIFGDACDNVLRLKRVHQRLSLELTKNRDGDVDWECPLRITPVKGTSSAVIEPSGQVRAPDSVQSATSGPAESARDRLLDQIRQAPGQSTGTYAKALGISRSHASVLTHGLGDAGLIENRGSRQDPGWFPVFDPLVSPGPKGAGENTNTEHPPFYK